MNASSALTLSSKSDINGGMTNPEAPRAKRHQHEPTTTHYPADGWAGATTVTRCGSCPATLSVVAR